MTADRFDGAARFESPEQAGFLGQGVAGHAGQGGIAAEDGPTGRSRRGWIGRGRGGNRVRHPGEKAAQKEKSSRKEVESQLEEQGRPGQDFRGAHTPPRAGRARSPNQHIGGEIPRTAEVVCFHLRQSAITTWHSFAQAKPFGNKIVPIRMMSERGIENREAVSKIVRQFFDCNIGLLQNGLQRFRFELPVHGHTRMQAVFHILAVRAGLADKIKTEAFQRATDLISGKVAGKFHAT